MSRTTRSRHAKPPKPRFHRLLLASVVAFAILLLLVRLLNFVHGHGASFSR